MMYQAMQTSNPESTELTLPQTDHGANPHGRNSQYALLSRPHTEALRRIGRLPSMYARRTSNLKTHDGSVESQAQAHRAIFALYGRAWPWPHHMHNSRPYPTPMAQTRLIDETACLWSDHSDECELRPFSPDITGPLVLRL